MNDKPKTGEPINIWMILFAVGVGLAMGWLIFKVFLDRQFDVFGDPVPIAPEARTAPAERTPKPTPTPPPYDPWRDRPKVGSPQMPTVTNTPTVDKPLPLRRTPTPPPPKKK
ncbi:MAG TPA: hypothetical protein PKW95_22015 [bacterium]|nr:hypothetical protein [bacterium]